MRAMRGEPLQSPALQLRKVRTFLFVGSLLSGSPKWCSWVLSRFQRRGCGFGFMVFYTGPSQSFLDLLKVRQVSFKWLSFFPGLESIPPRISGTDLETRHAV